MNKLFGIIFILICNITTAHTQNFSFQMGPEIDKGKYVFAKHLYSGEEGHYTYFSKRKLALNKAEIVLHKYDNKFKNVWKKTLKLPDNDIKTKGLRYFKDHFMLLSFKDDIMEKVWNYYVTRIDMDGKAIGTEKVLSVAYESKFRKPTVRWTMSKDTSHLLLLCEYDRNAKDEDYQAYYEVKDHKYNTIVKHNFKLPYSQNRLAFKNYFLSADNSVYILYQIIDDVSFRKKFFSNKVRYSYLMVRVDTDGKVDEYEVDIGDTFVHNIYIAENKHESNFILAAPFTGVRNGLYEGIFYGKFDMAKNEFEFLKKQYFTKEEIASFGRRNNSIADLLKNQEGFPKEYKVKDITIEKDDSFVIVLEHFRRYMEKDSLTQKKYFYSNRHVSTIHFDKNGEMTNLHILPKNHLTTSIIKEKSEADRLMTDYMFYIPVETDTRNYFIYNIHKHNLTKNLYHPNKQRTVAFTKHAYAVASYITDDGELKIIKLFGDDNMNSALIPRHSKQISTNQIFILTDNGKSSSKSKYRMGIITIED